MRISINDELADGMLTGLTSEQAREDEVNRRLRATEHVLPRQPFVVLNVTEMDGIAARIGTGLPIRSKTELLRAVDATAQLHLGDVRLAFTPGMLKQIEEKAQKLGETPERFVARIASKVMTDIFLMEPAAEGVFYTPGFEPEDEPVGDPE